jgi:type I restriction enzyme S subunit
MSYKKLGDIIKFISNKNVDGIATILYGINIDKYFMPSVANTIGVDLKKYKVVVKNQFACNRMHVGRDERLPISMSTFDYPFIVSPAYDVFEVTDENVIPEYLMLWFRRSEFDRQCWFYTDADVRGGLSLDALKSIEIRIPSIEKQREIVAQYQAVANKIKVNEQICEKLEATAQTLYKQWFVDFEFPNYEGQSYKSSGGTMEYNQELEKEIPEGWEVKEINSLCSIGSSKRIYEYEYVSDGIPFYRGKEITLKKEGKNINEPYFISNDRYIELVKKYGKPSEGDILMTAVGTIGSTYMVENEDFYFKDGNIIWFKDFKNIGSNYYLYDFMQSSFFTDLINEITIGSTQSAITISTFGSQKLLIPTYNILEKYSKISKRNIQLIKNYKKQNQKLTQLQSLLLSRLARLEGIIQ